MALHAPYSSVSHTFGIQDSYFKTKLKLGYQRSFWSPIFFIIKSLILFPHLDPPPEVLQIQNLENRPESFSEVFKTLFCIGEPVKAIKLWAKIPPRMKYRLPCKIFLWKLFQAVLRHFFAAKCQTHSRI